MYSSYDLIEYLMTTTGGGAQDQEHRVLRQAAFHAYRDLVTVRDWRWYHSVEQITLDPTSTNITTHVLPWGTQSVDAFYIGTPGVTAEYVDPTEWERLIGSPYKELVRFVWTVLPSTFSPDRFEVRLWNGARYSSTATLTYRRRPRDLRLTGWEPGSRSGTVSWVGSEITGTGTEFDQFMMGSLIRASGSTAYHPEGLAGMHPYKAEGLIYNIANSSKMYAWSPANPAGMTGTKYIVTDYLDVSTNMFSALLSSCEVWIARLLGKNVEGATGTYGRDLRLAFEGDAMAPLSGRRNARGGYYDFWYLRPGSDSGLPGGGSDGEGCPLKPDVAGGDAANSGVGDLDGGNAGTVFGECE